MSRPADKQPGAYCKEALKRYPPDDPREWLNRARSNLLRARARMPDVYLEDLCYDAQQAAVKAIKAVSTQRTIDFHSVHDLAELTARLQADGLEIPQAVRRAAGLTRYGTSIRYPGLDEPVTDSEYQEAVELAEAVVQWAEASL